jgi:hypothetical protein
MAARLLVRGRAAVKARLGRLWHEPAPDHSLNNPKGRGPQIGADQTLAPPRDALDGERIGPPDFVGVAAEDSGTAWWHRMLTDQPRIVGSVRTAVHYFEHCRVPDFDEAAISAYHRYFPRREGELAGEWTPSYALDPWTPGRLSAAAPRALVLVMLRDPVERFGSGWARAEATPEGIGARQLVYHFERGRYSIQLDRLAQHFPREQILVLQYERCVADPTGSLRETLAFLGVDPDGFPTLVGAPGPAPALPGAHLAEALRAQLVHDYSDEVRALPDRWPEIDLSLWPNFAHLADG